MRVFRGSVSCHGSHESREHHHHDNCPFCPPCVWNFNETHAEFATNMLTRGGPSDGICKSGYEKWIFEAKPFGMENDVCCSLEVVVAPVNCDRSYTPICPEISKIGRNEYIQDYYFYAARQLKDVPANGCCPLGTFKWIFKIEWT